MTDRAEGSETWLIGVVANEASLAGMRVNGGLLAAGPTSGRPSRVHVRLRFVSETDSGFPGPQESAALLHAEEQVIRALGDQATFVAAVTAPGFRDLIFHTGALDACQAAVGDLDAGDVGYDVEIDFDEDPGWSHYRAMFTDVVPADADRRRILDLARDQPGGPPECHVVHRFQFSSLADADQAAAALRTSGVMVTYGASDDVGGEAPPILEAHEVELVTQAEMARSRDALTAFAVSWNGTYDGWYVSDD